MRVLVDIIHPAHVHFFRNAIAKLQQQGHEVAVTARQKDVTIALLENLDIPFTMLSKVGDGLPALFAELITRDVRLLKYCLRFKPDVLTGISGMFAAHVGFLLRKPSVVFDDTEHQKLAHAITYPVATSYHSPDSYMKRLGKKQHLYPGCHELAYLHPNQFTPDPDIVKSLGVDPDSPYCIIRFVSWGAHHDVGQHGFADEQKLNFIKQIEKYAMPLITSEGQLPQQFQQYELKIPVHQIHHLMAFAKLCVGEGATMISESAVLGVPAIYINTLKLGYINMLEGYGLVKQTTDTAQALEYCLEILKDPNAKDKYTAARTKLLAEKIDVTEYIVETLKKATQNH